MLYKSAVYPVRTIDAGRLGDIPIEIDGKTHTVSVRHSSPTYYFKVDGSHELRCCGHPVDKNQGIGVPSAAEIAIRVGTDKPDRYTWARWWEEGARFVAFRKRSNPREFTG